jgi:hypothetical protein
VIRRRDLISELARRVFKGAKEVAKKKDVPNPDEDNDGERLFRVKNVLTDEGGIHENSCEP